MRPLKELCQETYDIMCTLPDDEQQRLKRCYGKTWSLVFLTVADLAIPTEHSRRRLEDVRKAVQRYGTKCTGMEIPFISHDIGGEG